MNSNKQWTCPTTSNGNWHTILPTAGSSPILTTVMLSTSSPISCSTPDFVLRIPGGFSGGQAGSDTEVQSPAYAVSVWKSFGGRGSNASYFDYTIGSGEGLRWGFLLPYVGQINHESATIHVGGRYAAPSEYSFGVTSDGREYVWFHSPSLGLLASINYRYTPTLDWTYDPVLRSLVVDFVTPLASGVVAHRLLLNTVPRRRLGPVRDRRVKGQRAAAGLLGRPHVRGWAAPLRRRQHLANVRHDQRG